MATFYLKTFISSIVLGMLILVRVGHSTVINLSDAMSNFLIVNLLVFVFINEKMSYRGEQWSGQMTLMMLVSLVFTFFVIL